MTGFVVKDSGARQEYDSGMRRDTQEGKPRFDLIIPVDQSFEQQMLTRWALHMTLGADKYGDRNWELATGIEEYERFKGSALRHLLQWFTGMRDEDHAAAVFFNIAAAEYVLGRMEAAERAQPGAIEEGVAALQTSLERRG